MNSSISLFARVTIGQFSSSVLVFNTPYLANISFGNFKSTPGYNNIQVELTSTNPTYSFNNILVSSFNVNGNFENLNYVADNSGSNFFWGRRGSTCYLDYPISNDVSYFMNDFSIPIGYDPIGSNFAINSFG
jgi:hypothetical protein